MSVAGLPGHSPGHSPGPPLQDPAPRPAWSPSPSLDGLRVIRHYRAFQVRGQVRIWHGTSLPLSPRPASIRPPPTVPLGAVEGGQREPGSESQLQLEHLELLVDICHPESESVSAVSRSADSGTAPPQPAPPSMPSAAGYSAPACCRQQQQPRLHRARSGCGRRRCGRWRPVSLRVNEHEPEHSLERFLQAGPDTELNRASQCCSTVSRGRPTGSRWRLCRNQSPQSLRPPSHTP
jgi:hypothetical protein